jgi:hypothetical protein
MTPNAKLVKQFNVQSTISTCFGSLTSNSIHPVSCVFYEYIGFLEHLLEEDWANHSTPNAFISSIVLKCGNGQWRKGEVVSGEFLGFQVLWSSEIWQNWFLRSIVGGTWDLPNVEEDPKKKETNLSSAQDDHTNL